MKKISKDYEINQIFETFDKILNTESFINESGTFSAPLKGTVTVTSPFGQKRTYETHPGVDLRAPSGTEILSPADGVVVLSDPDNNPKCGGTLDVQFTDGFWGRFCHVKALYKKKGDPVKQGDVLGLSGGDAKDKGNGNSKDAHIHFTLKKDGKLVDPMDYIDKAKITTGSNTATLGGLSSLGSSSSNLSGEEPNGNILDKITYYLKKQDKHSKYYAGDGDSTNIFENKVVGSSIKKIGKDIIIPKGDNRIIKSPVTGYVVPNFGSDDNVITIEHDVDGEPHFLEFSNLLYKKASVGDKIREGEYLGEPKDDVKVSLYNKNKSKIDLNQNVEKTKKETEKVKKETEKVKKVKKYKEPKQVQSKKSKSLFPKIEREKPSRYASKHASDVVTFPFKVANAVFNAVTNKKVNEEIERIKKLL